MEHNLKPESSRNRVEKSKDAETSPDANIDVICAICVANVPEACLESHVKSHISLENLSGVPISPKAIALNPKFPVNRSILFKELQRYAINRMLVEAYRKQFVEKIAKNKTVDTNEKKDSAGTSNIPMIPVIEVEISDEESGSFVRREENQKGRISLGTHKCKDPNCPHFQRNISGRQNCFQHMWRRLVQDFPDLSFFCFSCAKQMKNPYTHVDQTHGTRRHFRIHFGSEFNLCPTERIPDVKTLKQEYLNRLFFCFPAIEKESLVMGQYSADKMFKEYSGSKMFMLPPDFNSKSRRKRGNDGKEVAVLESD